MLTAYALIGLTIAAISVIGAIFVYAGWQFGIGFTCGFLFLATMVRIKYGFWPDY